MSVAEIATSFVGPIGINRLLKSVKRFILVLTYEPLSHSYIEKGGQQVDIRPWFWILLLFFGSIFRSLAAEWYEFVAVSVSCRLSHLHSK